MSVPHDDLVRSIRLYLSEIGGLSVKIDTPGLLYDRNGTPVKIGKKGVLDIIATIKGRFVAIDAKMGRDRLKPDQVNFVEAVTRAGGIAFAAWSVDDVANRLKFEGLA
jgi:penicillin-binding protein-related factor A (putative recombinase)